MTDPGAAVRDETPDKDATTASGRGSRSLSRGTAILIGGSFLLLAVLQLASVFHRPDPVGGWAAVLVDPANPRWTLVDPLDGTEKAVVYFDVEGKRMLGFGKRLSPPAAGKELMLWRLKPVKSAPERVGAFRLSLRSLDPDLVTTASFSTRDVGSLFVSEDDPAGASGPGRIVAATRN